MDASAKAIELLKSIVNEKKSTNSRVIIYLLN